MTRNVFTKQEPKSAFPKSNLNLPCHGAWTSKIWIGYEISFVRIIVTASMSKTIYKDLVNTIHIRDQYYIIIVNPTIFYKDSNPALKTSLEYSIFIKENNSKNNRDINTLWININKPINFFNRSYLGNNTTPEKFAKILPSLDSQIAFNPTSLPASRRESTYLLLSSVTTLSPDPITISAGKTSSGYRPNKYKGLPDRKLIRPLFIIQNSTGPTLTDSTTNTNII
ncbi:hypothetical protein N7533_006545 [Penicillium manginii]|uniref:uncharacterized protein n=1 Tax=Penicillium manginii TaxID=203109 RepID=UPI0025495A9B|nr:uncharacterized protein N7533_006545 [Penicillium manginii]KAJ5749517.1 hypothetical protein N7533_006545 [Penicillium manginii]